jgi:hypothetical protein
MIVISEYQFVQYSSAGFSAAGCAVANLVANSTGDVGMGICSVHSLTSGPVTGVPSGSVFPYATVAGAPGACLIISAWASSVPPTLALLLLASLL